MSDQTIIKSDGYGVCVLPTLAIAVDIYTFREQCLQSFPRNHSLQAAERNYVSYINHSTEDTQYTGPSLFSFSSVYECSEALNVSPF